MPSSGARRPLARRAYGADHQQRAIGMRQATRQRTGHSGVIFEPHAIHARGAATVPICVNASRSRVASFDGAPRAPRLQGRSVVSPRPPSSPPRALGGPMSAYWLWFPTLVAGAPPRVTLFASWRDSFYLATGSAAFVRTSCVRRRLHDRRAVRALASKGVAVDQQDQRCEERCPISSRASSSDSIVPTTALDESARTCSGPRAARDPSSRS